MAKPQARVHVAMIVGNDVTADTRVKKSAASLARHGYQVTVLGLAPSGSRTETSMGEVRIIRLPVDFILRDHRRKERVKPTLPRLGYVSKAQYVTAKRRSKLAEREYLAKAGRQRAKLGVAEQSPFPLVRKFHRRHAQSTLRAHKLLIRTRRQLVSRREAIWRERMDEQATPPQRSLRTALPRIDSMMTVGAHWRRLLPEIDDYELTFGPELDRLKPDVIHAHDVHMIGIAERAASRARLRGRHVHWVYDAHEYVPGLARYNPRVLAAYVDLEREYIRRADRIITVSDPIAEELVRKFQLQRKPSVVMNAPLPVPPDGESSPSVRRAAGVNEDVPLLVYSGGADASRGVHTIVEALPQLPEVHLALVVKAESGYVRSLRQMAQNLGCGQRVHVVPFVEPDRVVPYLASATAAVHPLAHYGNHEVALPNKLFEYMHARLPVIVSDVKAMAELTQQLGVGEVFRAEDPVSFATEAAKVLGDPQRYRRQLQENPDILHRLSWPRQEKTLIDVYRELLHQDVSLSEAVGEGVTSLAEAKTSLHHTGDVTVALGPRNMAGQAWEWAKALERSYPGLRTRVFTIEKQSPIRFPADDRIPTASWKSLEWQVMQVRQVLENFSHVVLESGSGLFGTLNGPSFEGDLPSLQAHGIDVAIALHGSDVRDPYRHRELEPYSPFKDMPTDVCQSLQAGVDDLLPRLERFTGPVFVTTMDLMDYVPRASWLPVVIDTRVWTPRPPPLGKPRPVVVHAPSNVGLKGSQLIQQKVEDLHARELIDYRLVQNAPANEMPKIIADADIVLDQFALGDYGALAVQAMAAGRIVVGHVHERVRARLPADLPIVEATGDTISDVLADILGNRDVYIERAANDGPAYVRRFHDGTYAAGQLAAFLGQPAPPAPHADHAATSQPAVP